MNEYTRALQIFALLLVMGGGAQAAPADAGKKEATSDLDALTARTWQWVSFRNPVESFAVESPADYTLTFNTDGIVEIVSDCNTAIASYGVKSYEAGSLSMVVTPRTKAACASQSRGDQFLLLLGRAARYYFKDGQLVIDLKADKGAMFFSPAEAGAPTSPSARAPTP